MNIKISKNYIKIAFWLSIAISILEHFTSFLDEYSYIDFQYATFQRFLVNSLMEVTISFLISMLLFVVNYYLLRPFQLNKVNKFMSILLAFLISFIVVVFLTHYLFMLKESIFARRDSEGFKFIYLFRDFITAFAVIISTLVIQVINQNQKNRLEIQNLKIENLQRQFEAFKNQVSPHFLFNSLNTMNALIREAPDIAQEYLSHLSMVLRYTLQANENKLVSVQEELKFVDSYFFLVKLRYGNNIELHQKISDALMGHKMPPLALQILIENAVKHNEISKRNHLEIIISEISNETMQIKNNINVKYNQEKGTGLGLANLTNQYRILSGKEISIYKDDNFFIVELPILKI